MAEPGLPAAAIAAGAAETFPGQSGDGDAMILAAAKKRKKKKARPRPASPKARPRKQAPVSGKRRKKNESGVSGYFSELAAHFSRERYTRKDWGRLALLAVTLAVVLYYAFSAGGFFVARRGYGELVVLYALVMGLIFALRSETPSARREWLVISFLGAYVGWMLLSTLWSLSPADSFNEFNRGVLYLAGFLVFYLFMARREWLGWAASLFVIMVAVVAVDGLLLKIVPDIMVDYFDISALVDQITAVTGTTRDNAELQAIFIKMDAFQTNRLSYPITYWNTMGLFMIMATPLALRAAADRMRPIVFRCLNAAALVLFVAVVYFTFSRAGYLLFAATVLAYTLLSAYRLRTALHAGLLALWAGLLIAVTRLWLPAMIESQPPIDDRVSQGHQLGWLILLLVILAVAAQVVVAQMERRVSISEQSSGLLGFWLAIAAVVVVILGFGAITRSSGGPVQWVRDQLSGAAERSVAVESAEERIFSLQSERYDEYRVSLKVMADNPLNGSGAGTWETGWLRERPYAIQVKDGHSWLFDTMAETGLIGFALLGGFVVTFVMAAVGHLRRVGLNLKRGYQDRDGEIFASVFVACGAMLLHSIIDWDWEMPVVTLSFFIFAGALLRYGILSRTDAVTEGDATTGADAAPAGGAADWWVWALGVGCIVMMALTVLPVIGESRFESARQHLDQAEALAFGYRVADGRAWYEQAQTIASGATKFNPLDARLLVQEGDAGAGLAQLSVDEGERDALYREAEKHYLEALKLQPDNFATWQKLGDLYLRWGEVEKAARAISRARALNPLENAITNSLEERVRAVQGF